MLDEDESLILHALEHAGFTPDLIGDALSRRDAPSVDRGTTDHADPYWSDGTRAVLETAAREAVARGSDVINGSHVLLGLLQDDGTAGQTLRDLGVQDVMTPVAMSILNEGIAYGRATSGRTGDRTNQVALADIAARLERIEQQLHQQAED